MLYLTSTIVECVVVFGHEKNQMLVSKTNSSNIGVDTGLNMRAEGE